MSLIRVFGTIKNPRVRILLPVIWLAVLHVLVLCADFFSPYDFFEQKRFFRFAPPTTLHFVDSDGHLSWRPFVCRIVPDLKGANYLENCGERFPVRMFVSGSPYKLGFLTARRHLFGVDQPGAIHLMGTDGYGRDQFSRFLHGGRVSLLGAILACSVCLFISLIIGTMAGFYGGWIDSFLMWSADLFLALPWLYFLLAVRVFLPLELDPSITFLVIIVIIAIIGWPRPARLIRGTVLAGREREYLLVARSFGASDLYLIVRHVIPQTMRLVATQASLLIPRFVLAEITLSFLGLGVNEPAVSWGLLLSVLQQYHVLVSYYWMFFPAFVLAPTFYSYATIADVISAK